MADDYDIGPDPSLLLVDDEESYLETAAKIFKRKGIEAELCTIGRDVAVNISAWIVAETAAAAMLTWMRRHVRSCPAMRSVVLSGPACPRSIAG